MKLNILIGLAIGHYVFSLCATLLILWQINKSKKEILLKMTEQEQALNEQLERQSAALDTVSTGVNSLKETITELKEEIRILTENNPDLEDEIAKASGLADKAEQIASGMAEAMPPPQEQPGNENGANSEPAAEADASPESSETASEEAESSETPGSETTGQDPV